jgi:hypothetical protein
MTKRGVDWGRANRERLTGGRRADIAQGSDGTCENPAPNSAGEKRKFEPSEEPDRGDPLGPR